MNKITHHIQLTWWKSLGVKGQLRHIIMGGIIIEMEHSTFVEKIWRDLCRRVVRLDGIKVNSAKAELYLTTSLSRQKHPEYYPEATSYHRPDLQAKQ